MNTNETAWEYFSPLHFNFTLLIKLHMLQFRNIRAVFTYRLKKLLDGETDYDL